MHAPETGPGDVGCPKENKLQQPHDMNVESVRQFWSLASGKSQLVESVSTAVQPNLESPRKPGGRQKTASLLYQRSLLAGGCCTYVAWCFNRGERLSTLSSVAEAQQVGVV